MVPTKPAAQSELIDWRLAETVAAKLAAADFYSASYLRNRFDADCQRLGAEAVEMVQSDTGLIVAGDLDIRPVDRVEWIRMNLASLRRLMTPLVEPIIQSPPNALGRKAAGVQIGALLAWMSKRVLGQYDPQLFPESTDEQNVVYMVVPNIIGMENRFGFPPEQFRLWIAVHECTHRAQFAGVSWMPQHFRGLVDEISKTSETVASDLPALVSQASQRIRATRNVADQGLAAALASPEQLEVLHRVQGMMALFEGHAEVVMSRAAKDRLPDVGRFHRVIEERRASGGAIARVVQRLLGMEAKVKQYSLGASFVRAVEAHDEALLARVWQSAADLPNFDEIKKPQLWIDRQVSGAAGV